MEDKNKMNGKEQFIKKNLVICIGALICCALWGSASPCIKLGYEMFHIASGDVASVIVFAGVRFCIAGILALLIGSALQKKWLIPKKESYFKIFKLSIVQTVLQYFFLYIGLANTTGVKGSIINGMNVFFTILVASLIFKQESLNTRKITGCIFGFAGVVLVNLTGTGLDLSFKLMGEGFVLLCAISYAFSSALIKRYSQEENPVILSGGQFLMGGIVMVLIGYLAGGRLSVWTAQGVIMLIYMAMISAVAYSIWGILLKYNPVSKVSIYGFMNPLFGVILSAIFLQEAESLGLMCFAALILVCIGIYIVNKESGR